MTTHGKGEVVLVPVDFTDRSGSKFRPAVIVSDERYNRGPARLIVSVTGNLDALPHPGDHVVADWREAGLRLPRSCR